MFFFCCLATAGETRPAPTHTLESEHAQNQAQALTDPSAEDKQDKQDKQGKQDKQDKQEEEEDHARESFELFTRKWMQKLVKTEDFQKKKMMKIIRAGEGFVAEYTGYLPHRYTVVKLTKSKLTPFVGILTYYKKKMRSVGKTKGQAINGLFEQAETSQVSEIFRYTKGKWVY